MKKIAIAIEGIANSGKTSTIREVAKIISEYLEGEFIYAIDNNDFCSDDEKESELKKIKEKIEELEEKEEKGKPHDIRLIIYLNNGIKIGIESQGDLDGSKRLITSLKIFNSEEEKKCDIILFAMSHMLKNHNDDIRYEEVNETLGYNSNNETDKNEYDIVWINKNKENESRRELDIKKRNEELAEKIYNKYIKCFIESDKSTK